MYVFTVVVIVGVVTGRLRRIITLLLLLIALSFLFFRLDDAFEEPNEIDLLDIENRELFPGRIEFRLGVLEAHRRGFFLFRAMVAAVDVVIVSTYLFTQATRKSRLLNMIRRIHWHRVCIDEAHMNNSGDHMRSMLATETTWYSTKNLQQKYTSRILPSFLHKYC